MDKLDKLVAYNVIGLEGVEHALNARPFVMPYQNNATPTAAGGMGNAIITIGDNPFLWNALELGSISSSSTSLPMSFYMQINVFDMDNEGLFGGPTFPRASTVFGAPQQIEYAIQPVKLFLPHTKIRIEWTNNSLVDTLGFELFFRGIEIGLATLGAERNEDDMLDRLEEMMMERRVR